MSRRLDPIQRAAAKHAARCPDCDSHVTVDETTDPPQVQVAHDDECPAFEALRRQRRAASLMLVGGSGQSSNELATLAARALREAGSTAVVRPSPYSDLHSGGGPLSATESQDPGTPRGTGTAGGAA